MQSNTDLGLLCRAACRGARDQPAALAEWIVEVAENLAYMRVAELERLGALGPGGEERPSPSDVAEVRTQLVHEAAVYWRRDPVAIAAGVAALVAGE